ncbi:hypothetical protein PGTUg99_029999 [Puccinia graminis f. sp. tritici]|uniref:Uncharacterized protein n=1 Tax=Puccinia graminis f. sp. tritici TaxID=56615 RepID=A0A5B0QLV4_PUCGR|nr:hypothetical protein PGTUg99_029999 [Puccinia graminis f. sp. tritici]
MTGSFGGKSGFEKAGLFTDSFHSPNFTGQFSGTGTDIEDLEDTIIILVRLATFDASPSFGGRYATSSEGPCVKFVSLQPARTQNSQRSRVGASPPPSPSASQTTPISPPLIIPPLLQTYLKSTTARADELMLS